MEMLLEAKNVILNIYRILNELSDIMLFVMVILHLKRATYGIKKGI